MDFSNLKTDLESQTISGKILLDKFRLIDEDSRKTSMYLDPKYSGFYYYLGKYINPKNVMEIGFDLGLLSGSFFTSCKSVEKFLGFKEKNKEFTSLRLGKANIKLVFKKEAKFYVGELFDDEFDDLYQLIIITEEGNFDKHLEYLEFAWNKLEENGLIVQEYISRNKIKDAFVSFCESKNRKPEMFETRYGTGIIEK